MISLALTLALAPANEVSSTIRDAYVAHMAKASPETQAALRAAYEAARDSQNASTAGIRGMTAHILEREGEAYVALREALHQDSLGPQSRHEASVRLAEVAELSGFVNVHFAGAVSLTVTDTRHGTTPPLVNTYRASTESIKLRLREGEHTLRIESDDGQRCSVRLEVQAARTVEHTCAPATVSAAAMAPPPPLPPARESNWLIPGLVGGGAVAAGSAVAMYIQARRVSSDTEAQFDDLCRNTDRDPRCGVGFDAADGPWRTGALVLTGVATAAVLAGTAVYLWDDDEAPVTAWVSPMGGGLRATF